jgi:hypothetical protein
MLCFGLLFFGDFDFVFGLFIWDVAGCVDFFERVLCYHWVFGGIGSPILFYGDW